MLAGMAAMLVAAMAVPGAFGRDAVLFGAAYVLLRLINLGLYMIAGRRDEEFLRTLARFGPAAAIGPLLILAAGFVEGSARLVLWVTAIVALYLGPLIRRGRGWRISPAHFSERYGLVVIIALGESIVAIGVAAAGLPPTVDIVAAAVLGLAVLGALWWAYFDVIAVLASRQLSDTSGVTRVRLARDYFSWLHMPMIAGIVLFALGLEATIHDRSHPLAPIPAAALCGGLSLYFLTHVVMRIRLVHFVRHTTTERPGYVGPGRLAATLVALALIPVTLNVPALAALALLAAMCWSLIVWDVRHYREDRVEIRRARP
jgi:low temperature requirement protein LtrA